jgi:hypothetical protein
MPIPPLPTSQLPFIDEHTIDIAAGGDQVWSALVEAIDASFLRPTAQRFTRVVGCAQVEASGPRPLAEGSTVPGFLVETAVPGSVLALAGHHRYASYALTFRLEAGPHRTRVRAETRASFPGVAGGVYRLLVISGGGHAVAVRRLLSRLKRQVEWQVRSGG